VLRKLVKAFGIRTSEGERDTDRDWQLIGASEPYFGVLTGEEFKRANFDADTRLRFYASGRHQIDSDLAKMQRIFGDFHPRSALDFGCGVGRLTVPLADVTGDAIGVDVSPGMLAEARLNDGPNVSFVETMPDRLFDWVVSHIVLQHIPPERGYAIIQQLLSRISDGGGATIHIVFARTDTHSNSAGARVIQGEGGSYYAASRRHKIPAGIMLMHDYDISLVISQFYAAGFRNLHLEHTDHGGMIGAVIYARKFAEP